MLSRHGTGASTSTAVLEMVVVFFPLPALIQSALTGKSKARLFCARSLPLLQNFISEPG